MLEHREGMAPAVQMFCVSVGVQADPVGLWFSKGWSYSLASGWGLPSSCLLPDSVEPLQPPPACPGWSIQKAA